LKEIPIYSDSIYKKSWDHSDMNPRIFRSWNPNSDSL